MVICLVAHVKWKPYIHYIYIHVNVKVVPNWVWRPDCWSLCSRPADDTVIIPVLGWRYFQPPSTITLLQVPNTYTHIIYYTWPPLANHARKREVHEHSVLHIWKVQVHGLTYHSTHYRSVWRWFSHMTVASRTNYNYNRATTQKT